MKIYKEPVYDLNELARYNLHVHTTFSGCAQPEMTVEAICKTAEEAGVEMIALTDHNTFDWDDEYMAQIAQLKKEYAALNTKVKVLFSSELSCYGVGKFVEKEETAKALDYRLVSCNHFHLDYWGKPEDTSARGYAVFALELVKSAMESRRYDCIAHPLIGRFVKHIEDRTEVSRAMTDNELGEICELSAKTETALEINVGAVLGDPALFRRLWNLGREAGATFHFGTDAHRLVNIDTRTHLADIQKIVL